MTDAFTDEFRHWLSHVVAVACSARRNPDAWQAIRRACLPCAPATASYLGEAAHPSEVREVLVAFHTAYAARQPPGAPGESQAMRDFRHQRTADFVRAEADFAPEQRPFVTQKIESYMKSVNKTLRAALAVAPARGRVERGGSHESCPDHAA